MSQNRRGDSALGSDRSVSFHRSSIVMGGGVALCLALLIPAACTTAFGPVFPPPRAPGPWSAGFPGKVFTDSQCPDLYNTGSNYTPFTCQALCDVRLSSLHPCPCSVCLEPPGPASAGRVLIAARAPLNAHHAHHAHHAFHSTVPSPPPPPPMLPPPPSLAAC